MMDSINNERIWKIWNSLPSFRVLVVAGASEFRHNAIPTPHVCFTFNEKCVTIKYNPESGYNLIIEYDSHKTFVKDYEDLTRTLENNLGVEFEPEYIGLGI